MAGEQVEGSADIRVEDDVAELAPQRRSAYERSPVAVRRLVPHHDIVAHTAVDQSVFSSDFVPPPIFGGSASGGWGVPVGLDQDLPLDSIVKPSPGSFESFMNEASVLESEGDHASLRNLLQALGCDDGEGEEIVSAAAAAAASAGNGDAAAGAGGLTEFRALDYGGVGGGDGASCSGRSGTRSTTTQSTGHRRVRSPDSLDRDEDYITADSDGSIGERRASNAAYVSAGDRGGSAPAATRRRTTSAPRTPRGTARARSGPSGAGGGSGDTGEGLPGEEGGGAMTAQQRLRERNRRNQQRLRERQRARLVGLEQDMQRKHHSLLTARAAAAVHRAQHGALTTRAADAARDLSGLRAAFNRGGQRAAAALARRSPQLARRSVQEAAAVASLRRSMAPTVISSYDAIVNHALPMGGAVAANGAGATAPRRLSSTFADAADAFAATASVRLGHPSPERIRWISLDSLCEVGPDMPLSFDTRLPNVESLLSFVVSLTLMSMGLSYLDAELRALRGAREVAEATAAYGLGVSWADVERMRPDSIVPSLSAGEQGAAAAAAAGATAPRVPRPPSAAGVKLRAGADELVPLSTAIDFLFMRLVQAAQVRLPRAAWRAVCHSTLGKLNIVGSAPAPGAPMPFPPEWRPALQASLACLDGVISHALMRDESHAAIALIAESEVVDPARYSDDGLAAVRATLDAQRNRIAAQLHLAFLHGGRAPRVIYLANRFGHDVPYIEMETFHVLLYRDLQLTPAATRALAALWSEWIGVRAECMAELRAALAALDALPGRGSLPPLGLPAARSDARCPACGAPGALVWAHSVLGACAASSGSAQAAAAALRAALRSDAAAFARFRCALIYAGRGFGPEAAARLVAERHRQAGSCAPDIFRMCQMAAAEHHRTGVAATSSASS